jgi:NADPH:quinone reductase-like Zn-dependent oxidoreductase
MALYFLSKANIQSGQQVVIYGASGANGTCAVQLAKHLGAEVTAVCSTANVELLRSLGADTVLDYTKEQASALRLYDVVFDAVGRRKTSPMKAALSNALTPAGKFISVDDRLPRFRRDDLIRLKELAEAGKLKPVIDRRYPLERIAEAHRYVEQGHKKGSVVITMPIDLRSRSVLAREVLPYPVAAHSSISLTIWFENSVTKIILLPDQFLISYA